MAKETAPRARVKGVAGIAIEQEPGSGLDCWGYGQGSDGDPNDMRDHFCESGATRMALGLMAFLSCGTRWRNFDRDSFLPERRSKQGALASSTRRFPKRAVSSRRRAVHRARRTDCSDCGVRISVSQRVRFGGTRTPKAKREHESISGQNLS